MSEPDDAAFALERLADVAMALATGPTECAAPRLQSARPRDHR